MELTSLVNFLYTSVAVNKHQYVQIYRFVLFLNLSPYFSLVSVLLFLLLYFAFLSHPSLYCHSGVVYNGIPFWNISLTRFPRAYLFLLVSSLFFQTSSCLCSIKSIWLADSYNTPYCHGTNVSFWRFLTYTSILLSSHTHRDYTVPSKLACWTSVYRKRGFLGNTEYGKTLYLPAHQVVNWQLFLCKVCQLISEYYAHC